MKLLGILVAGILLGLLFLNLTQNKSLESPAAKLILNAPPTGGDFTLTSSKGPVSLHDFKGKVVLAYFGYTFCPDICPTNLGNLSVAYNHLTDAEKKRVQILFISVDPKRDTPARLQEYANYFDAKMIGLTANKATIDKVAHRYGVIYVIHKDKNDPNNYSVDHSAFTYVINPKGTLIEQLPHGTTPDQFIKAIQQNLK